MDTYPTREYISIYFPRSTFKTRPPENEERRILGDSYPKLGLPTEETGAAYTEKHPVPYSLGLSEGGARLQNVARKLTRDAFKRTILITGSVEAQRTRRGFPTQNTTG